MIGRKVKRPSPVAKVPWSTRFWREFRISAAIFLIALAARLIVFYQLAHNPTFNFPIVDAQLYDATARELVAGHGFGFGFFWQPLFYPLSLAAVYAVAGGSLLAAKLVQLVIGALTCVLVYHLGRRIFDRSIGVVAALITAFYGPLVFFEGELVGAGWAAFWSALLVLVILWASDRRSVLTFFVAGLCSVLAILVRPAFLPFVVAAALFLFIALIRHRVHWGGIVLRIVAAAVGFAVVAWPVAAQCRRVAGYYSILPASGGLNLHLGNNANTADTLTVRPGDEWMELQNEAAYAGHQTPLARSQYFQRRVREYAAEHPLAFLSGLLHKTGQFLNGREVPRNTSVYVFGEWSPVLRGLVWKWGGFGFPWTPLLAFAVVGLVWQWRRVPTPVKLYVLLYPAAVILVFIAGRYRVPVVPVFAVLAAAGIVGLVRQLQARQWPPAMLAGVVAVVAMALTSLQPVAPEERIDYASEMYVLLGDQYHPQDAQQAIAWYEEALRREPGNPRAHSHLAALLAAQGRSTDAQQHFARALEDQHSSDIAKAFVHFERAQTFVNVRDWERALPDLNAAIELYPRLAKALCLRGTVLEALGRPDDARRDWVRALDVALNDSERAYAQGGLQHLATKRSPPAPTSAPAAPTTHPAPASAPTTQPGGAIVDQLRAAVERDPNDPRAQSQLGNWLAEHGEPAEALSHLQAAAKLAPNAKTHYDLGVLLLRLNQPAEAQTAFEQVVAESPSAPAWHNLAIAHARQGQLEEAVVAFRNAIEVNPRLTDASFNLARALDELGRPADAIEALEQAVEANPDDVRLLTALAWRLATSPVDELRNGPRAVELADRAAARSRRPGVWTLDAQAAAYAEVGRFDDALQTIQRAVDMLRGRGQPATIEQLEARLRLYEQHQPFREPQHPVRDSE